MLGYYVDGFEIYDVGNHEGTLINFAQFQPDIDTGKPKRIDVCNIKMDNKCAQSLYDALENLLYGNNDTVNGVSE